MNQIPEKKAEYLEASKTINEGKKENEGGFEYEEIIEEYRAAFSLYENEETGTVSVVDVGTIMRALGLSPTEAEIQALLPESEEEGKIGFQDFVKLVENYRKDMDKENPEEKKIAFGIFDRDNNGKISLEDLKQILYSIGEKLSDEEIKEMMSVADLDKDGALSFEEFMRIMDR